MKRWYTGILVVLFVALATTLLAYGPRAGSGAGSGTGPWIEGQGGGLEGPIDRAANLNLSQDQMDKMRQMREKFRSDTQSLRHDLFQRRLEMRALFADPKADEATIIARQKELNALRQNMMDRMVDFRLAQRRLLTPEQLNKLSEVRPGPAFRRMGMDHGFRHGGGRLDCGPGCETSPGPGSKN